MQRGGEGVRGRGLGGWGGGGRGRGAGRGAGMRRTPGIAFRHLPPNSARFGYAAERTLYLRAAVHRRGQRPPKGCGSSLAPKHARKHETHPAG